MIIAETISQVREAVKAARAKGKSIGFVPTMGYLHEGHLSLVEIAKKKSGFTVVSIYVNPTQFSPNEDLDQYPRDPERDKDLLRKAGTDLLFFPDNKTMYPPPYHTFVNVEKLTEGLCGRSRPGHFKGVATIVTKLFNIVQPDISVFGEKDFQQLAVIKQMVRDLNIPTQIIGGPIVREDDGLAMSSRNRYLTPEQRSQATVLYRSLMLAVKLFREGEKNPRRIKSEMEKLIATAPDADIDYIEFVNSKTLTPVSELDKETRIALAVFIDKTRLIDNISVGA